MEKRLQTINNDTVLEITEQKPVKTRLSENKLLERKTYLESAITKFQSELAEVTTQLAMIDEQKNQV